MKNIILSALFLLGFFVGCGIIPNMTKKEPVIKHVNIGPITEPGLYMYKVPLNREVDTLHINIGVKCDFTDRRQY